MKSSCHSTKNSQFQSITSKSSNSSIISILREPSPDRPKKTYSVRFDDSPSVSVYSESRQFEYSNSSSPTNLTASKSPSPLKRKPLTLSPTKHQLKKIPSNLTLTKNPSIRIISSPEPQLDHLERKTTPTIINYSFRNQGFYDKLNKFYSDENSKVKIEPGRVFIKLHPGDFESKTPEAKPVIQLRPCSSKVINLRDRKTSPKLDLKPTKNLRCPVQNILN